jgi:hypothetical protein
MAHLDATAKRQTGLHMGGILDPAGSPARPASWGEAQVLTLVRGHLEQQATVAAYQDCFMLVTLLCLANMPLVLLLRRP